MSETHIILWSIVILEVTLALLTGGTNNNEGKKKLDLDHSVSTAIALVRMI